MPRPSASRSATSWRAERIGHFRCIFKSPIRTARPVRLPTTPRVADIESVPAGRSRCRRRSGRGLSGVRAGKLPWIATLTPAELMIARSHGIRPIAAVSATCWLHYGWSWTEGHSQGWATALAALARRGEGRRRQRGARRQDAHRPARRCQQHGFHAGRHRGLHLEGLPPSNEPIVATVPALEFVKLLEADVVPTGIAIGALLRMADRLAAATPTWRGSATSKSTRLSELWEHVRQQAHAELRAHARGQGNGVLAHINFSQMFEREGQNDRKQYLARHIVVATTVDAKRGVPLPHEIPHGGRHACRRHAADRHQATSPVLRVQRIRGSDLT